MHGDAIGLRAKGTRTTPFWVILAKAKEAKLTEACMRVRDYFEGILVKETLTLVTVLPRGVVLAVLTNATADPTAGLVHSHVKVASARVAIAVTLWKQNKQWDILHHNSCYCGFATIAVHCYQGVTCYSHDFSAPARLYLPRSCALQLKVNNEDSG